MEFNEREWELQNITKIEFKDTAQNEIDQRLIEEDPDHPDSIELRRLFQQSERASEIATALLLTLELCIPKPSHRRGISLSENTARIAGTKLITLLWMLRSESYDLAHISQSTIAKSLGTTRALISFYARFWNKATGLRCRQQKLSSASEVYRAAAIKSWQRRKGPATDECDMDEESAETQHQGESWQSVDLDHDEETPPDEYIPSWNRGRSTDWDLDGVAD
jgi:hypothetical protein